MVDLDTLYSHLFDKFKTKDSKYSEYVKQVSETISRMPKYAAEKDSSGFIPYPSYENEDFSEKIFNKKEFNIGDDGNNAQSGRVDNYDSYATSKCPSSVSSSVFKLTQNQKFIKNFMSPLTPYNGILLFHSVGVGKTCTAISIAEQYHQLYKKPVLVILSHTLIENFKKQIFDITKYDIVTNQSNLCTGTTYPDMVYDKTMMKPDLLEKTINKIINRNYKFIGYKKLVSIFNQTMEKVKKQEKDSSKHEEAFYAKIKEYFSDRMIIIDEAHNLRNSSEKGTKQTAQTFWQLLKYTENVKLVLLTATPMFNSATEIVWLLNLLLTNDKRQNIKVSDVFDKNGNLTNQGVIKLKSTARGYISYMRGENPFTFPFRLYPSINRDTNLIKEFPSLDYNRKKIANEDKIKYLEIVGSQMSNYQKSIYDIFKRKLTSILEVDEDALDDVVEENEEEEGTSDLRSIVQISNVVYPIDDAKDPNELKKAYGKLGFDNTFVNTSNKGLKLRYTSHCLNRYGEILSYKLLPKYAPKIKSILDYVISSQGIVFVYSNYYPSGIKPLAIALEQIGFVKYNSPGIIDDSVSVENKFGKSRPAYVVISRNNDLSPNNDKEIEIVKSKENADGSIIKVVIASQIASEGIDFKRMREVHILEPWYNLNRSEQIIGRAVRTCSHIDLPKEQRNVTIYFHGAIYDKQEESIDLRTYRIAERKQKKIVDVEGILKETSIDCNLNKGSLLYRESDLNLTIPIQTSQGKTIRKFRVGDKDYSSICNYSKCQLKCEPDIKNKTSSLDETTYDSRFIMDDIALYKRYVKSVFSGKKKALTYTRIYELLQSEYKKIDEEPLQYALQEMLDDKTPIVDNQGVTGYLIYKSNKYLFQSSLSSDKKLTIEQREQPVKLGHRPKLDVAVLKNKLISTDEMQNKTEKLSLLESISLIGDKSSIDYLQESVSDIVNNFTIQGIDVESLHKYIIDSVIDRLNHVDLLKFVADIVREYNKGRNSYWVKQGLKSLMEAGVLLLDKENRVQQFYNHYDGDIYCLRDNGVFKKCSPLEYAKVASKANDMKQTMTNELPESVKGHIEVGPAGCDFKVRDNPKSSGYVCWKTSSLSLSDLKERIISHKPKLVLDNVVKKDMCLLYELILRSQGKKLFKRSLVKKLK